MAWIAKTETGRWKARYRTAGGETRSRTWDRKVDAERWLRSELAKRDRGKWVDPKLGRVTFGEWWSEWMKGRVHLEPTTRARDESVGKGLVLTEFENARLSEIQPADVRGWVASLTVKGYAPLTTRKAYQLLSGALNAAVDDSIIGRNPAARAKLPPLRSREMRFLDVDAVAALANTIDDRYRVLVATAAYTGLRWAELAGLRVRRVDLLRRRLTVVETLVEVKGQLVFKGPKTAASRRAVTLPRFVCDGLAAHLSRYPTTDLMFTSTEDTPLRRTNFRRRDWLPAVRASVGEPMRFHDLRHTHAALLIAQGEHPKVIQNRLGHASIRTTLDTYGHLFDGLDEGVADRLEKAVAPSSRPERAPEVLHLDTR
jgi:integrase